MSNRADRSGGDGRDGPAPQTLFVCLNIGLENLTRAFWRAQNGIKREYCPSLRPRCHTDVYKL
jgi:hypothetical protein